MFLKDEIPIICKLPRDIPYADIYFLHDIHFGSELFDERKWKAFKANIQNDDLAYVCWIGDLMENAIPNSKSDMFSQTHSPAQQKEWAAEQLFDLREKTLAVVAGNHEHNRTTKMCGIYPLYDVCMLAGVDEKYRDTIAYLDIGVGSRKDQRNKYIILGRFNTRREIRQIIAHRIIAMGLTFSHSVTTTAPKTDQGRRWFLTTTTRLYTNAI